MHSSLDEHLYEINYRQLFNGCLRSLLTNSPTNIKNPSKSSAHEQADFFDVPTSGG
jgi:hypothetical protein